MYDDNETTDPSIETVKRRRRNKIMKAMGKITVGTVALYLLIKFTPFVDIMYAFTLLWVVPLAALLALGAITTGTFDILAGPINSVAKDLRERINKVRESYQPQEQQQEAG